MKRWGGVEDDGDAGAMGETGGGEVRGHGNLELQDEDVGLLDGAGDGGAADVGGGEVLVGAGGDDDLLFAMVVDADEGDAGGGARIADDVLDVDAFCFQAA